MRFWIHSFIHFQFQVFSIHESQILFLRFFKINILGFWFLGICILERFNSFQFPSLLACSLFYCSSWKQRLSLSLKTNKDEDRGRKTISPCVIACLVLFYIWSKLHLSVKTTTSQPFLASIFIYKYLCKLLYSILLYNYNSRDDPPVAQKQKPISGFSKKRKYQYPISNWNVMMLHLLSYSWCC